jgi:hypothetical protein
MSNSTLGVVTKLLTVIPFAVALYFFDFTKFAVVFSPSLRMFFLVSVALFAVGVMLKHKIIKAALQLSDPSFAWGALLLAFSVALYLYGAYSSEVAWYRYESLFLFVLGYVAFRIGTKVLRFISPLLLILALSFAPLSLFPASLESLVGIVVAWIYLVAFLAYTRPRVESAMWPTLIAVTGLAEWQIMLGAVLVAEHLQLNQASYLYVLLPLPVLILLLPNVRAFLRLPGEGSTGGCPGHIARADGFCSICGVRISAPKTRENFGPWGLLTVAGVTVLLLFVSVPALTIVGGVPHDATYTAQGYSSSAIIATPSGWQVNSTTLQEFPTSDLYAVVKVYVPLYHPDTKNYTVYYEVATGIPTSSAPSGGDIPGWSRLSNDFMQYGPYHGYLTTYTTSSSVMLSYQGTTQMLFVNNGTFQSYYVGLGFVRVFKNSNTTADTTQFLGDVQALWLPAVEADVTSSTWTGFLSSAYDGTVSASPFLLLVSSVGVMSLLSVQVSRRDDRLDRFLALSSVQSERSWSILSLLLARKGHTGTTLDLAVDERTGRPTAGKEPEISPSNSVQGSPAPEAGRDSPLNGVRSQSDALEQLEQRHLVRRILVEKRSDPVSAWSLIA